MGRGLPYCEWRNWLESGVGGSPLVLHPQCNAPPGAELGTAKSGVHKHPLACCGLPDTPVAAGRSSPIHLVTVIPTRPLPHGTHRPQTQTARPDPGHTGELDVERVLKWQQRHGAGIEASSGQPCVGASPVRRGQQHEEDLPPWPGPSVFPGSGPSPGLVSPGEVGTLALGVNSQLRGGSRCFWGSGRGFLHCRSRHTRQPPCWIGMTRLIRCSDNMLRKARKK